MSQDILFNAKPSSRLLKKKEVILFFKKLEYLKLMCCYTFLLCGFWMLIPHDTLCDWMTYPSFFF